MKTAIIGTGNVGKSLGEGLVRAGHEVHFGSRDPRRSELPKGATATDPVSAARWADVVVLAVPFGAVRETVQALGPDNLAGKTVVDVTNALTPSFDWALGFSTSGAEELAKLAPRSHVVKAFNTVFASHMSSGHLGNERLSAFVAGDDDSARTRVLGLAKDLGFDPVDAGPLRNARTLEAAGILNISLGFGQHLGTGIGLKLVRAGPVPA